MDVVYWNDLRISSARFGETAMTMGVFDGFHRGHQSLVRAVTEKPGLIPTVVTFLQNPKKILSGKTYKGDLSTLQDKLDQFSLLGVQRVLLIDFSVEFSKMSGREFFAQLQEFFNIRFFAAGYDFSFGRGSETSARDLNTLLGKGTILSILPPVQDGDLIISSTALRTLVHEGKFVRVSELLGRAYRVCRNMDFSHQETEFGCSLPKIGFYQVLPGQGSFRVRGEDGTVFTIHLDEESVRWNPGHENNFRSLTFI